VRAVERFSVEAVSAAPPERVFAVLADGSRWQEWAGPLVPRSSWAVEADPPGSVGSVRRLGLGPLASLERVVAFEPPRLVRYVVDSPSPARGYTATVELAPEGPGTRITWSAEFEPAVPGTGGLLRATYRGIVGGFARRLARAAEVR
jgi:uncharacterized protein YndB with AHSA1/START domain